MKRLNLSYINVICVFVLSFAVMEYVNLLIGRVGGFPVLAGVLVSYSVMRYGSFARKNMACYMGIYILTWFIGTVVLFISKYSGWGNIKKLGPAQYFKALYGSTLSEIWGYFFAIVLMLTVIVSLFPLIVIKNRKIYARYVLGNTLFWTIIFIPLRFIDKKFVNHKVMWQAGCMMAFAVLLLVLELFVVYRLVKYRYCDEHADRKVRIHRRRVRRKTLKAVIVIVPVVVIAVIVVYTYFMSPSNEPAEYEKVASCITNDDRLGPMVYDSQVYIPITIELDYAGTGSPLGYIVYKDQDYGSRYYELAASNLLYMNKNGDDTYLQMAGNASNSYKKLSVVEKSNSWKDCSVFLMWDEEWQSESRYSKDVTGYTECDEDFIKSLEDTFGAVKINPADFKDYDAYFTIEGYKSMKDAIESDSHVGTWVGCILAKDDKFYYGSGFLCCLRSCACGILRCTTVGSCNLLSCRVDLRTCESCKQLIQNVEQCYNFTDHKINRRCKSVNQRCCHSTHAVLQILCVRSKRVHAIRKSTAHQSTVVVQIIDTVLKALRKLRHCETDHSV